MNKDEYIYTARSVIEYCTQSGRTVNMAALDISKAFDRVDHCGLFVKLMNRRDPNALLSTVQNWFIKCYTCVRWCSAWSSFFQTQMWCQTRYDTIRYEMLF